MAGSNEKMRLLTLVELKATFRRNTDIDKYAFLSEMPSLYIMGIINGISRINKLRAILDKK